MLIILIYTGVGLAAGVLSGLIGIGGGIFVIPALVYLVGFSQHQAQGTALAMMVPPIGILAAWSYYTHGFIDLKAAGLLALGFLLGGYLGAQLAFKLSNVVLGRIFGILMIAVGVKLLLNKT